MRRVRIIGLAPAVAAALQAHVHCHCPPPPPASRAGKQDGQMLICVKETDKPPPETAMAITWLSLSPSFSLELIGASPAEEPLGQQETRT